MNALTWQPLPLVTQKVPAKPHALWTRVHDYVTGPAKRKIQASGAWNYSGATRCGPDGSRTAGFAADTHNTSALLGALIGKVGGGAAEKPDAHTFMFVAGAYVVIVLDANTEGALCLTMNDQAAHFEEHSGDIDITIEEARSG